MSYGVHSKRSRPSNQLQFNSEALQFPLNPLHKCKPNKYNNKLKPKKNLYLAS